MSFAQSPRRGFGPHCRKGYVGSVSSKNVAVLYTAPFELSPCIFACARFQVYEITLTTLKQSANNERLWFNTYVKYGKACLNSKDFAQLSRVVNELHRSCQLPDGRDDPTKGTYLLEVYALEIQARFFCSACTHSPRLSQSVYHQLTRRHHRPPARPSASAVVHGHEKHIAHEDDLPEDPQR